MRKYQELVRPDAPWCPSNIEFIRRINGLEREEDVRRIVFDASYFVLGLGDVYLGAPVATPIDPRHRLVTTKYNPALTWTPENAVGIGGAYMCIYGMEGPGGYQLFGRTIQVWNSWRETPVFERGKPWLLRFFDQIRFFPVSADELMEARAAFPHGEYPLRIEDAVFSYAAYQSMLNKEADSIAAFKNGQQNAFHAERERWKELGEVETTELPAPPLDDAAIPEGCIAVTSEVPGSVWQILKNEGDTVAAGEAVIVVESMKMEISISSAWNARIREIRVRPGQTINAGQIILVVET
jgi:urea carboxylase